MNKILIIICTHGNEQYGLEVQEKLSDKYDFLIGNPLAVKKNDRFISSDLNRSFPGDKNGNYEEKRAVEILNEIKKYDFVIDLHSTSESHELIGIITKSNKEKIEFAKSLGMKNLVLMPDLLAGGKAVNDFHKCLVTFELGPHGKDLASDVIMLLENTSYNNDINIYEIFDKIEKLENTKSYLKNLGTVKKGDLIGKNKDEEIYAEFDFIPILANEISYKNILCFAAKKIR